LKELSSRIKLDIGDPANPLIGPLGFTKQITATELIHQVVQDPQFMWKRSFYLELNMLPQD